MTVSTDPRGDFWQAFFDRTKSWSYVSEQQAGLLSDCACAQAMFECASWTSNLYVQDNNAIGYKYYSLSTWQSGPGIVSPEGDNYAAYNTIGDCARELADWIHRRAGDFMDVEDINGYLDTMVQDGYAAVSASQYAQAQQFYSATDLSSYSDSPPSLPEKVSGFVDTAITTNYGMLFVGGLTLVLVLWLLGIGALLKKLRL